MQKTFRKYFYGFLTILFSTAVLFSTTNRVEAKSTDNFKQKIQEQSSKTDYTTSSKNLKAEKKKVNEQVARKFSKKKNKKSDVKITRYKYEVKESI